MVWDWDVASYPVILAVSLDSPHGSHVPISKIPLDRVRGMVALYLASLSEPNWRGLCIPRVGFFVLF